MSDRSFRNWLMPVAKLEDFEELNLNGDGIEVLFDAVPGTIIRAPLSGIIYDVRDDEGDKDSGSPRKTVEVLSLGEDNDPEGIRIFNIIDGLDPASVPLKDTVVRRGDLIGRAGAGEYTGWDQSWRTFVNMPGEQDGAGRDVNPIKFARSMGSIQYLDDKKTQRLLPEFQGPENVAPKSAENEPVFEPVFEPAPQKNNKKTILVVLAGLAAWKMFGKKGK